MEFNHLAGLQSRRLERKSSDEHDQAIQDPGPLGPTPFAQPSCDQHRLLHVDALSVQLPWQHPRFRCLDGGSGPRDADFQSARVVCHWRNALGPPWL